MHSSTLRFLTAGLMTVCLGVGCGGGSGPKLAAVTGLITIDGNPAPGIRITFVPEGKGSPSYGATDKYGKYRLLYNVNRAGAQLGKHNVLIENTEPQKDEDGKLVSSTPIEKVSRKYQQPGALSAEIHTGRNKLDFDLDADTAPVTAVPDKRELGSRTASK